MRKCSIKVCSLKLHFSILSNKTEPRMWVKPKIRAEKVIQGRGKNKFLNIEITILNLLGQWYLMGGHADPRELIYK